jgi:VCBS repeat-containing protein
VLANDIEPDGQTLSATLITPPTHGTLLLNTNGTFSYTPAANYVGLDSFVYAASDGSFSSNATATITVSTGPNSAPVAVNDSYTVTEDTVLTVGTATGVLANDTDAEGDPLTAAIALQAAHGTVALAANGSFTYTPGPNFFGSDSFTYRAADPFANSIPAIVSLTVNGTPDAPAAVADNYATDRGAPLSVSAAGGVLANDSDADGQAMTAELVSNPTSGTLSLSPNGAFTYTPAAGFSGTDTFSYRASDGTLTSPAVTATILVNSRPVAAPDTYAATEDTTLNVPAGGVLANDIDPDNEPITAVLVANATNGNVTLNSNGSFAYAPAANFNGTDTFTYRATDGARNSAGRDRND